MVLFVQKSRGMRFRISNPLVKDKAAPRSRASPNKMLNVEAQPFTPMAKYNLPSPQLTTSDSVPAPPDQFSANSPSLSSPSSTALIDSPKSEHLTSNIVHMLTDMYKYPFGLSPVSPIINYPAMFPQFGAPFIQHTPGGTVDMTTPLSSIQFPRITGISHSNPMFIVAPVPTKAPHSNTSDSPSPRYQATTPHSNTSDSPSPETAAKYKPHPSPRHCRSSATAPLFVSHQSKSTNRSCFSFNVPFDVSSIPLPPERVTPQPEVNGKEATTPPVSSDARGTNEMAGSDSPVVMGTAGDSPTNDNDDDAAAAAAAEPEIDELDSPTPSDIADQRASPRERTCSEQRDQSAPSSPPPSGLSVEPFVGWQTSSPLPSARLVLPTGHNGVWARGFPGDAVPPPPPHLYRNFSSFVVPPQTPSIFLRHGNPLEFIQRDNLFPFHGSFHQIPPAMFAGNANGGGHDNNTNGVGVVRRKSMIDESAAAAATGIIGAGPFGIGQQLGNYYVQPVNLICFRPPPA